MRSAGDARAENKVGHLVADAGHHFLEKRKPSFLYCTRGSMFGECRQADAGLEHVHRVEMIFPALIENVDENELFQVGQFLSHELPAAVKDDLAGPARALRRCRARYVFLGVLGVNLEILGGQLAAEAFIGGGNQGVLCFIGGDQFIDGLFELAAFDKGFLLLKQRIANLIDR